MSKKGKPIFIAKLNVIPKAKKGRKVLETREQGRQESGEEEAASVMIVSTPPNKESRSMKRKREIEEVSPSTEAVSEANLKDTSRWFWQDGRLQLTGSTRNP